MLKVEVTFQLEDEQLMDLFESRDVKFSKSKVAKLKKLYLECQDDFQAQLEEAFEEILAEIIDEEWGE
jgi:hypothetical protein